MELLEPKNIGEILEIMNIKRYMKNDFFHILKIEEHYEDLIHKVQYRSGNFFEVSFAKKFDVEIGVDETSFSANTETGYLMFSSPGQITKIDVKEVRDDSSGYIIFFSLEFLNFVNSTFGIVQKFPYFNIHSSPVYFIEQTHSPMITDFMEKIYNEFQIINESNIEIIKSWLTLLLFESMRLLKNEEFKKFNSSRAEEITYKFENILKSNFNKERKIEFYADQLNISSIYLSECVKKSTGISIKKIITEYIIAFAKSNLENTDEIIEQIAYQSGFEDVSNFSNFFKRNVGKTPNQYRKLNQ